MISQITNRLFLSQAVDVIGPDPQEAIANLRELGITHIVSVCPEPDLIEKESALFNAPKRGFQFVSEPVPTMATKPDEDPWKKGLYQAINIVNEILQADSEAKVLVHCVEGVDRSPFIVANIIAQHNNMRLNQAYEVVKVARPIIHEHYEWLND